VSVRTLVIATWGQPALWRMAYYMLEDENEGVEHCTTLPLLLKHYNNSDVALLVLDSLIDEFDRRPIDRAGSKCFECYDRLREFVRSAASSSSYKELKKEVKVFAHEMLKCLEIDGRVEPIVCPAVGKPGGKWDFNSSPRDYEAVALAELGLRFLDQRYDRVVLDVSHGINFMPSVTLRVAERFAGLLLVAHGFEQHVTLEVYNSDPYPTSTNYLPKLRLNLVARERVSSVRVPSSLPSKLLSRRGKEEPQLVKKEDDLNRRYREVVRLSLSALYYPLPLVLHYSLCRVQDQVLDVLRESLAFWEENVKVDRKSQAIRSTFRFDPDAVYALLLVEAVEKRIGIPEYPARLEVMKRSAGLYKAFNESYYHLVSHELDLIEKRVDAKRPPTIIKLCELYDEGCGSDKPDKRIMIAHAGLQKELVKVDPCGNRLFYTTDGIEKLLGDGDLLVPQRD